MPGIWHVTFWHTAREVSDDNLPDLRQQCPKRRILRRLRCSSLHEFGDSFRSFCRRSNPARTAAERYLHHAPSPSAPPEHSFSARVAHRGGVVGGVGRAPLDRPGHCGGGGGRAATVPPLSV